MNDAIVLLVLHFYFVFVSLFLLLFFVFLLRLLLLLLLLLLSQEQGSLRRFPETCFPLLDQKLITHAISLGRKDNHLFGSNSRRGNHLKIGWTLLTQSECIRQMQHTVKWKFPLKVHCSTYITDAQRCLERKVKNYGWGNAVECFLIKTHLQVLRLLICCWRNCQVTNWCK